MNFSDFNLDSELLAGINSMGYSEPTPIQQQAIPAILDQKDLIACAQTGTGKTAAFVLPLLNEILKLPADGIHALIIVPTRELAIQIDQQVDAMSYFIDVRSMPIYGGGSGEKWVKQKRALTSGVDIIIATPGRLMAQMKMGGIDFSRLNYLVLDEADRMMDMGFYDDIISIVDELPKKRQTLCFSATMPPKIRQLTKRILHDPAEISIAIAKPADGIKQEVYHVVERQKLDLTCLLLKNDNYQSVIIFASSKDKVKKLTIGLNQRHIPTKAFHSDLDQVKREELMQAFKNSHIKVLVGTDILSRGIDVEGIDLVINYDVPHAPDDYVHRIGRTARADTKGTAITLINQKDQLAFSRIEALVKEQLQVMPLPEGFIAPEKGARKSNQSGRKVGGSKKRKAPSKHPKSFKNKSKTASQNNGQSKSTHHQAKKA